MVPFVRIFVGAFVSNSIRHLTHIGTIIITNYKFEHTLKVPGLHFTLISEPALDKSACTITAANGQRNVSYNGHLVLTALLQDGTSVWDPDIAVAAILKDMPPDNLADLWHCHMEVN